MNDIDMSFYMCAGTFIIFRRDIMFFFFIRDIMFYVLFMNSYFMNILSPGCLGNGGILSRCLTWVVLSFSKTSLVVVRR